MYALLNIETCVHVCMPAYTSIRFSRSYKTWHTFHLMHKEVRCVSWLRCCAPSLVMPVPENSPMYVLCICTYAWI
jgi:hypothetical protein